MIVVASERIVANFFPISFADLLYAAFSYLQSILENIKLKIARDFFFLASLVDCSRLAWD